MNEQQIENKFNYQYGIVEGRLIENGFFGIGSPRFVCRTANSLYVVTFQNHEDSKLEIYQLISGQPEPEMEINEFVDWVRDDEFNAQVLTISGDIDDIFQIIKLAKPHFQ